MTVWITVGLPGSGKSTLAKMLRIEHPDLVIIERDAVRKQILKAEGRTKFHWSLWDFKREPEVSKIVRVQLEDALSSGANIVIADTNLRDIYRVQLLKELRSRQQEVRVVFFDLPSPICWKRNISRDPGLIVNKNAFDRMVQESGYGPVLLAALERECQEYGAKLVRLD